MEPMRADRALSGHYQSFQISPPMNLFYTSASTATYILGMIQLFFTKEKIVAPRRLTSFLWLRHSRFCGGGSVGVTCTFALVQNFPPAPGVPRGVDFHDPGVIRVLRFMANRTEHEQRETKRSKSASGHLYSGRGGLPLLSRRSAIPPHTIPPSAPMS